MCDVQFYPYTPPGEDPVFAVTGGRNTLVCRPVLKQDRAVEILQDNRDDEKDTLLNSLCWSQDINTGDPLICVASDCPPNITVLNVRTGKLARVLTGHGKAVNDIKISPSSPTILASASKDHTVRVWNLEPEYQKQACSVIFAGHRGHEQSVMSIAFHQSGRYLVSGAQDTAVKLWVIPELPTSRTGTDNVMQIQQPHFSTTELHCEHVDCVKFYGDLVLSKASGEGRIVLWKIDGFNSANDPPSLDAVGTTPAGRGTSNPKHGTTESAFGTRFQILMQFDCPDTTLSRMRFDLFHMPQKRPILAVGDEQGKLLWWDLQRFEEMGFSAASADAGNGGSGEGEDSTFDLKSRGPFARIPAHEITAVMEIVETSDGLDKPDRLKVAKGNHGPKAKWSKMATAPNSFVVRGIAWSTGGEWAVAVGDGGMVCLFRRWD
ncbi:WD40 repeat-like protein [Saccharata proteae CBS 121410]|uniref:WD40 repeat-like protein n=1 Tax=Saccharata proteae CBS 121410 TaxID=1314787 RepID=A0A9P4I4J1_9PEZI|nr:WD40 repeat-like protein [Saccharata proteae CBS 121410]